jgi:type II secretory pathway component PulF
MPEAVLLALAGMLVMALLAALLFATLFLVHFLVSLPMRRAERARLFLDILETALARGESLEESIISISKSQETAVGLRFHLFAACLEKGLSFGDALAAVPRFLLPPVAAMLRAGRQSGDLGKVIPAARHLLRDSISTTWGALSYVFTFTFLTLPVAWFACIFVAPRFNQVFRDLGIPSSMTGWIFPASQILLNLQTAVVLMLVLAAAIYIAGPRIVAWVPALERFQLWLPWRRKRLQRDFSSMLAILLDSGVSEPEAVGLAADCTANTLFRRKAGLVLDRLREGVALPEALKALDDTGEFGWRLRNAFHSHKNFLRALAGWHESLDAKAFQQQQGATHAVTSALIVWNGLFVGAFAAGVFLLLISIIEAGVLW